MCLLASAVASQSGAGSIINVTELWRQTLHINLSEGPDSFQAHAEMQRSSPEIEARDGSLISSLLPRVVCI